jgi:predicted RNA polymerase sigma factor
VVASLERAFRDEWGHVLAALTGALGDLDLAEDAAQEAFAAPPSAGRATAPPRTRAHGS